MDDVVDVLNNIQQQLADLRERVARLEEKIDVLATMQRGGMNGREKLIQWIVVAWLIFISALLGIEFKPVFKP